MVHRLASARASTLRAAPFSYDRVGGTAGDLPDGYRPVHRRRVLVRRDFDGALDDLMRWRVHEPEDLVPAAVDLARSFVVDRSPVALALAKQLLYRNSAAAEPLDAHLSDSLAMFWTSLGDGKEGVAAFKGKRAPRFTGKASDLPRIF